MRVLAPYSFKSGLDILESPRKAAAFAELRAVLGRLPPYRRPHTMLRPDSIVSPIAMNRWLDYELSVLRDWEWHPLSNGDESVSGLRSDFRKARIEVEIQFGNMARYAYDLIKMGIAVTCNHADVGILVLPTYRFMTRIGCNIAHAERATRELDCMRASVFVPVVILPIEPETWEVETYPEVEPLPCPCPRPVVAQLMLFGDTPRNGNGGL